tara:strand:+ start:1059 stop:1235 length:177 start_codon:yes stop_codon:yes gene_type:complete
MNTQQTTAMTDSIKWLETCPYKFSISSFTGGCFHVKIFIPYELNTDTVNSEEVSDDNK